MIKPTVLHRIWHKNCEEPVNKIMMMNHLFRFYSHSFLIIWAASEQGIEGPLQTTTAWNLAKGDFIFHYNSRFYYNNKNFIQSNGKQTGTTY